MPELAPSPESAGIDPAVARRPAGILGLGTALPEHARPSSEIEDRLGVGPGWIESRTGIRERRVAAPEDTVIGLAACAAERALAAAGVDPGDIGLVLVATMTPDRKMPNAAAPVAGEIGASAVAAMDVNAACTGFVSALTLAAAMIESGRVENAIVIGSEIVTPFLDADDRRTAGLFGDGAGAAVLGPSGRSGIGPAWFGVLPDPQGDLVGLDQGEDATIRMNGHDTFKIAVDQLSEATHRAAGLSGIGVDDIDLFVYHQANSRILRAVGERLGLEPARVADYLALLGNTSSATVPLALAEANRDGRLSPGDRVLVAGFGAGMAWGSLVLEWEAGETGEAANE